MTGYQILQLLIHISHSIMNIVEKIFENKAKKRRNLLLFSKLNAIEFIEECKKYNIEILGIDGFELYDIYIQPFLEHSIDFTTVQNLEDINNGDRYHKAIEFLKSRNDDLFFEIVCND